MRIITPLLTLALGGLLVGATLLAQEAGKEMRPTAEHAILKNRVGTWDAAFKMSMGPGQVMEDKATMTWSMMGDFWLMGDYEGKFMGQPFMGHEMTTFDPASKQFVHYWIDSTSPNVSVSKGTWDEATKTLTLTSLEKDPMSGVKSVSRYAMTNPDTIKFTMTPEGAKEATMEILYTRKK